MASSQLLLYMYYQIKEAKKEIGKIHDLRFRDDLTNECKKVPAIVTEVTFVVTTIFERDCEWSIGVNESGFKCKFGREIGHIESVRKLADEMGGLDVFFSVNLFVTYRGVGSVNQDDLRWLESEYVDNLTRAFGSQENPDLTCEDDGDNSFSFMTKVYLIRSLLLEYDIKDYIKSAIDPVPLEA